LKNEYNGGVEARTASELHIVGRGKGLIRHAAGALPAVATKTAVGLSAHFTTTVGAAAPFFTTASFTASLSA
jgi:hypothetical protein